MIAPEDVNGPLNLPRDLRVELDKPGCFDHGLRARVRRWLPWSRSYALRLEGGGVVFARPAQLVVLLGSAEGSATVR